MSVPSSSAEFSFTVTNASFEVYSVDQTEHIEINGALIVGKLPGRKLTKYVTDIMRRWRHLTDILLDSLDSDEILLLIGCDVPDVHWVLGRQLRNRKRPCAVKTLLGWTVPRHIVNWAMES